MKYIIGVYFNHSYIKVAMFDSRGHYLHYWEDNLLETGPEYINDKIAEGINYLLKLRGSALEKVIGIGITLEGQVDFLNGTVIRAKELVWDEVPFRQMVQDRLGKPTFIDHSTNCEALAEIWQGAGWGKKDLIYVDCTGPIQFRVIRDKKIERPFTVVEIDELAERHGLTKSFMTALAQIAQDTMPEAIVLKGIGDLEDNEFWKTQNRNWHQFIGKDTPELVPAELGTEALTVGAAALVLF